MLPAEGDQYETSYSLLSEQTFVPREEHAFLDDNMRVFSSRDVRRVSFMHRITNQKLSLREKLMIGFSALLLLILIITVSKKSTTQAISSLNQTPETCDTRVCIELSANILASLSETIDPCDDFFEFACENWIKEYPMPKGKSTWGTLHKQAERTSHEVRHMLEKNDDVSNIPYGANLRRIYDACMDFDEVNKLGADPAQRFITTHFGGWSWDTEPMLFKDLAKKGHSLGNAPFFGFGVATDLKDSNHHVLSIDEDGLSFMNRDYYVNKSTGEPIDFSKDCALKYYHEYMTDVICLLSPSTSKDTIKEETTKILLFEQKLAKIMMTIEQHRDFSQNYEDITLEDLMNFSVFDQFTWGGFAKDFFTNENIENSERVAVYARDYLTKLPQLIQNSAPGVLHNYVVWLSTKPLIYTLSTEFQTLRYDLVYKIQGVDLSCNERWRVCTEYARDSLPLIVGRFYVENYFDNETREQVSKFANSIKKSFLNVLKSQDWMDDETKSKAVQKAAQMTDKYGFPGYILNNTRIYEEYDGLKLESGDFWAFTQEISQWAIKKHLSKLREKVDKELWVMSVEETNAYYSPTDNSMVFPAGILQPPLYHPNYPSGFNYGAIGMIIGHEITHGFDDQGRRMGADGNILNWWGNDTATNFSKRTKCMEDQYSKLVFAGMNLNGELTLGENIADNGGIKIAYQAWQANRGEEIRLPGLQNFTYDQTFFLAQAQTWCSSMLDKAAVNQMKMDPHPPNKLRVNQGMRNFRPFADVWNCPGGSNMNPKERCNLW